MTLLDEPTVGLDPIGRDLIWEVIKNRSESGTVLLSTQYMYEAEYLCDEIVILDHGTVIAKGTPKKLLEELGGKVSLSFKTKRTGAVGKVSDLPGVVWVGSQRIGNSLSVKLLSDDQAATLIALRREISDASSSITIKAPTLDDVFQRVVAKGGIDLK